MSSYLVLTFVALLALGVLTWYHFRRYKRILLKVRGQQEQIANYERREDQRQDYCSKLGHDLDERCFCRRCLTSQHTLESIGVEEYWVEDDPGALYLSSDFQPTGHYEKSEKYACTRCPYRTT